MLARIYWKAESSKNNPRVQIVSDFNTVPIITGARTIVVKMIFLTPNPIYYLFVYVNILVGFMNIIFYSYKCKTYVL